MKGLNEFVAITLVIFISISGVILASTLIKPVINKATDNIVVNEGFTNLGSIDKIVEDIATETENSRRTLDVRVTDGEYVFDDVLDSINFSYKMKSDLTFSGQRNSINITTSNGYVTLFIKYDDIDFQNKARFGKGENKITIINSGIDSVTNKVKISITP